MTKGPGNDKTVTMQSNTIQFIEKTFAHTDSVVPNMQTNDETVQQRLRLNLFSDEHVRSTIENITKESKKSCRTKRTQQ